ncbi:MAG: hypothetical protein MJY45_06155 [Bacteroidales bacterium]|nr:hypothetical protein [Bacteroidales bacterium]
MLIDGTLFLEDITGNNFSPSGAAITVQRLEWTIYRTREERGMPGDPSVASVNIVLDLGENNSAKEFLARIKNPECHPFSIIFNCKMDNGKINDYRNGMVVWGYVSDLNEAYSIESGRWGMKAVTTLEVVIEANDITFLDINGAHKKIEVL